MISFKRISIKNFRAYEDVTIDFLASTGIFLISGGNGAGKSTFLNAINWCLYGDTPFYTTENIREVANNHASDDSIVSVEIFADIRGRHYRFQRSTRRGSYGGVLSVATEDNGNWTTLEGVAGQDAVRRILPKDLRHLFFFNGERLKDIFSKTSNEHDLKSSIYKVSEINIIDNAIRHLSDVESQYLKQITKKNRNSDKIDKLREDKEEVESRIEGHTDVINEQLEKRKDLNRKIAELDKLIKDTAESRYILEKRDDIQERVKDLKFDLDKLGFDKSDVFHMNFHRLILNEQFQEYSTALIEASKQGVIPPPINPTVTKRILSGGVCICGRDISEHERAYIEEQHHEYARMQDLQYLTDGILTFEHVKGELSDINYSYRDILKDERTKRDEKNKFEEELKKINESLEGIDASKAHDNPELRRTRLLDRIERINMQLGSDGRSKDALVTKLKSINIELDKVIRQDVSTQRLEKLRQKALTLRNSLYRVKVVMEESIRTKLEKSIWDTFSSILPDTNFMEIKLDTDYSITLLATDGIPYSTGMISEGTTKVLGLSLAHSLSKDLGYTDVPFLIDNLYGNIKDTHYEQLTKMVSSLADNKQIIIMDLNIDNTEQGFESGVISQKFILERMADENKTIIKEITHESK